MQEDSSAPPPGGARLVVVANRLPVSLERGADGVEHWRHSPGGLVNALEPVLREHRGAWVGWPGTSGPVPAPPPQGGDGPGLHLVEISAADVRDFYEGFSNASLWPLYHDVAMPPEYHRHWWDAYVRVNRTFARAAAAAAAPEATVWVQDYQLQLVPELLRELRPDVRIGFFLHIPFPPVELFMQLPWRSEIVRGLLGADLIGFQRAGGARNFQWLAERLAGAQPDRGQQVAGDGSGRLRTGGRTVTVGAFPISVDAAGLERLARRPETRRRARQIRAELGNPRHLVLGVDRLDYTKGIDVRLRALHEMLAEGRIKADDVAMVQIATPSRERVDHYVRMREDIERTVGRINGEFARVGYPAVHYLHTSVGPEELAAFYRAADVMLVTPLRDGMNLVCKEYVACRYDLGGALVLSEFAGAGGELTDAFQVNPHHLDEVKSALAAALDLTPEEGARRMAGLRRQVLGHDVAHWARSFLDVLAGGAPPAAGRAGAGETTAEGAGTDGGAAEQAGAAGRTLPAQAGPRPAAGTLRKAVIPAAGLGTRFLPATKATPKELLPVVDKPAIQYVVEEAVAAGLDDLLVVTGRHKRALEDHFDRNHELESALERRGDTRRLAGVREPVELADIHYVRQGEPKGLGDAVLRAAPHIAGQPFAVLLPDDLIDPEDPLLTRMAEVQARKGGSVVALMEVEPELIHRYGCARVVPTGEDDLVRVTALVEKPAPEQAPSNLAVIGRYVLDPAVFAVLRESGTGHGGELQLTDALHRLATDEGIGGPVHGVVFRGRRYDTGDWADYLRAIVRIACRREDFGPQFRAWLHDYVTGPEATAAPITAPTTTPAAAPAAAPTTTPAAAPAAIPAPPTGAPPAPTADGDL